MLPGGSGFWAMIGMAGIMSGAMRAPMTGALFAVELTGHFTALPLTIAAAGASYALSVLLMRRSILTEKIARRGRQIQTSEHRPPKIGRAHVCTPVTNAHLVCRHMLEKKNNTKLHDTIHYIHQHNQHVNIHQSNVHKHTI